jgi:hypothetical protein
VNGTEQIALVCRNRVILLDPRTGNWSSDNLWKYPGTEEVLSTDAVDWVQAATDTLVLETAFLLRGVGRPTLRFGYTEAMETMAEYDPDVPGTQADKMPSGDFALYYQDRLAVATGKQQVSVSDFLNFHAWSLLSQFKIALGGGDYLVAAVPFQGDKVLILCRKSVYLAYFSPAAGALGYEGSLNVETSWLRALTSQYGCVARRTVVEVGGSIWFLSDNGVVELTATLDLNLLGGSEALSAPLQPLMDRLSANYAGQACAVALRERVYFAVPLQEAAVAVESVTVTPADGRQLAGLTCATEPEITVGATVIVAGLTGNLAVLNGEQTVAQVVGRQVAIYTSAGVRPTGPVPGATLEPVETRPNAVLVFNTVNRGWESVDTLPGALRADWLLTVQTGGRRELWLVDRASGPARYEDGKQDMDGTYPSTGWPRLPQTLPFTLTSPAYNGGSVQGRFASRTYTGGDVSKGKRIRQARGRFRLASGDSAVLRVVARTPADETVQASLTVAAGTSDDTVRLPLGTRATEASVEVDFVSGAAALEMVAVESVIEEALQAKS